MKIYLAGPMTGYPENNYPAFEQAAYCLRAQGYEVVSPHELEHNADKANCTTTAELYREVIPGDIKAVSECDVMVMLPGWIRSKGAEFETRAAKLFDMPIVYSFGFTRPAAVRYTVVKLEEIQCQESL